MVKTKWRQMCRQGITYHFERQLMHVINIQRAVTYLERGLCLLQAHERIARQMRESSTCRRTKMSSKASMLRCHQNRIRLVCPPRGGPQAAPSRSLLSRRRHERTPLESPGDVTTNESTHECAPCVIFSGIFLVWLRHADTWMHLVWRKLLLRLIIFMDYSLKLHQYVIVLRMLGTVFDSTHTFQYRFRPCRKTLDWHLVVTIAHSTFWSAN